MAIGFEAGFKRQLSSSIAIGYQAGYEDQGRSGVIINATGTALDDDTEGHIHIASNKASIDYTENDGWTYNVDGVKSPLGGSGGGIDLSEYVKKDEAESVGDEMLKTVSSTEGYAGIKSDKIASRVDSIEEVKEIYPMTVKQPVTQISLYNEQLSVHGWVFDDALYGVGRLICSLRIERLHMLMLREIIDNLELS